MRTSEVGRTLIKQFEGLRLEAYQDIVGRWTIGYGSTRGVKPGDKINEAQANARLADDLHVAETCIARLVTVPLTQNQFDALADFVFNLGQKALGRSTLLRRLNGGNYQGAALEFAHWIFAGGKMVDGLRRRREAERDLFASKSLSHKEGA